MYQLTSNQKKRVSAHAQQTDQVANDWSIIPRPIHQAAAKQLIDALRPNDVLFGLVTPKKFPNLDFTECPVIVRGDDEQNFVFHLEEFSPDVSTALQGYYQQHPVPIQTVGIKDPSDFCDLTAKCGPGAAGKPKVEIQPDESFPDFGAFLNEVGVSPDVRQSAGWSCVDVHRIGKAFEIPPQKGGLDCAANSAARALVLIGNEDLLEKANYDTFDEGCPQDLKKICEGGSPFTYLSERDPGAVAAASRLWGLGTAAAAFNEFAMKLISSGDLKTGPSPSALAGYITEHIPRSSTYQEAVVYTYSNFKECADDILRDVDNGDPVIVFIFWEPTTWHYSTVVAAKREPGSQKPEGFILLETNQRFDYRKCASLNHVMFNDYKFISQFCTGKTPDNYNLIRFHKK